MTVSDEIQHLLKTHGAVLERKNKHPVWRFPDGRIFVHSSTPSDVRAERNNLSNLRKLLGVKRESTKNPERRTKRGVASDAWRSEPIPLALDWKAKLRAMTTPAFQPRMTCFPLRIERVPMTPVWCMLRNLIGYGGEW